MKGVLNVINISINKKSFIKYMNNNHMTLTKLANGSGTTVSTLSKFLNGYTKTIKLSTLTGLLSAMNLNKQNIGNVFTFSENNSKERSMKGDNNDNS